ncbi:tRNA lysidine(34) synthetase [Intestinibacillus massiliensis]|uniref:tRNA lysidine(34) synthetase n=1 Tax=Intestinibacillus massiliensis TaxID=1871029 RepID=UPI000B363427|nr:ATP-binding protein [Intestinibacillus massiliensis]
MTVCQQAERSLNTVFRKRIRNRVAEAVKGYGLLREGDRVAVCISGGKDSMLLAKCLQELQRHGDFPFHLEYLTMDPGYSPANRRRIEENAGALGIPLHIFETNVFRVAERHGKNPCFLCAKMRRGWLYAKARELGCNKIALGHHYDDVVETILMAMVYGGQVQTMLPKLKSDHYEGLELIRPLYLVREEDVIAWAEANGLSFLGCACAVMEQRGEGGSKRAEVKRLIAMLCEGNPQIKQNIMNSVKNINLSQVLGYHKGNTFRTFLDDYDETDTNCTLR